jgi:hypothetical protein
MNEPADPTPFDDVDVDEDVPADGVAPDGTTITPAEAADIAQQAATLSEAELAEAS